MSSCPLLRYSLGEGDFTHGVEVEPAPASHRCRTGREVNTVYFHSYAVAISVCASHGRRNELRWSCFIATYWNGYSSKAGGWIQDRIVIGPCWFINLPSAKSVHLFQLIGLIPFRDQNNGSFWNVIRKNKTPTMKFLTFNYRHKYDFLNYYQAYVYIRNVVVFLLNMRYDSWRPYRWSDTALLKVTRSEEKKWNRLDFTFTHSSCRVLFTHYS